MDTYRKCSLPQCSGLRFNLVHKFPRKIERAEEWLKAFDCPELNATPHSRLVNLCVCCRHFRVKDYVHRQARILNAKAVPSLNLKKLNELNKCRQTRIEKTPVLTIDEVAWLKDCADQEEVLDSETNLDESSNDTYANLFSAKISNISKSSIDVSESNENVYPSIINSDIFQRPEPLKEENTNDFELLVNEGVLKIVDSQLNVSLNVDILWLRSMCRCCKCYDDAKFISKYNLFEIQADLQPVRATLTEESRTLEIIWSDDHTSTYILNQIYEKFQSKPASQVFNKYLLWTSQHITYSDDLKPLQFYDLITNEKSKYTALDRLQKTGVLIFQGIPKGDKEHVLRKYLISKLFNHNWENLITEKRIIYSNHQSTPSTNCTFESMDKALQILTVPYYKDNAKIQLCLVDGFQAALQISKPSYTFLTQHSMDFCFSSNNGFKYIIQHPVITVGERIFFAPHNLENIKSQDFQKVSMSLKNFNDVLNFKQNQWNMELNTETLIIIDNYRICWCINQPLQESELECFYMERKHYLSSLNILKLS